MSNVLFVSESKKESIIQLCNVLCPNSISKITDLADGEILYKTIQDKFPEYCEKKSESTKCVRNLVKDYNPPSQNIFIDFIKSFIDDRYKIQSDNIVIYERCAIDESEIVKVAIFVLSEIVNHLFETCNTQQMHPLYYTDAEFQVELTDMFDCFIVNRHKLNKDVVEKLLSKSTKKPSPFATPRRTRLKEKNYNSPSTPMERDEIFSSSPLKKFFDSPFQEKVILSKEKEKYERLVNECDEREKQLEYENETLKKELKEREMEFKNLKRKNEDIENDNRSLVKDLEVLKSQYENVSQELTLSKNETELLSLRIMELNKSIEALQDSENEEKPVSKEERRKSFIENALKKDEEIRLLKKKVSRLELKIYAYKKELSEKILTELKDENEDKNPGIINRSYEDVWNTLSSDSKEQEEKISTIILEDNKKLIVKLNLAECQIQNLLKEIEDLKENTGKNEKSSQKKNFCSIGTMTVALNVQDILDTSKTPETERFRKSFNQSRSDEHCNLVSETSHILNKSDNCIPCEQSASFSKFETSPSSDKSPKAVLWKMYESQKSETESTYDINVNYDTFMFENSNLNKVNDLNLNNIKIGNIESNSLLNQENECVLGNLNFDAFLNELKKLTKNGSFQKVLQVFESWQKRTIETNKCDQLDLKEMLKVLTECLYIVADLNAEYSFTNLQDKCCSTDDIELCFVTELNELKNQLNNASLSHEIHLKKYREQIEKIQKEKIDLIKQKKASDQEIREKVYELEELHQKYEEKLSENKGLSRKLSECKALYEKSHQQWQFERKQMTEHIRSAERKKIINENKYKLAKSEYAKLTVVVKQLKEQLKTLKEEIRIKEEKMLKEKETQLVESTANLKDIECFTPFHLKNKLEFAGNAFQESVNDSVLSGAFQKSFSHYVSENEDDIFCAKPIKQYENERVQEIRRRNSLYPRQLQSSYPLECDLNTTYHSLYVTAEGQCKEQYNCKKRKLEGAIKEEPLSSFIVTPKQKKKHYFTPNIKKFIERSLPKKQHLKRLS